MVSFSNCVCVLGVMFAIFGGRRMSLVVLIANGWGRGAKHIGPKDDQWETFHHEMQSRERQCAENRVDRPMVYTRCFGLAFLSGWSAEVEGIVFLRFCPSVSDWGCRIGGFTAATTDAIVASRYTAVCDK